jgi:D-alanyl-D-alanine carboxypeptidase/D-alanyl-D-alanine-endopeptidase (penicillin-binding protein 4)
MWNRTAPRRRFAGATSHTTCRWGSIGKWHRLVLISALASITPLSAYGAGGLTQRIERIFARVPGAGVQYAVHVVDLAADRVVFSHNADLPLIPASNQKLITLAAAVDRLAPNGAFETVLGMRGPDLVIVGDGDPALGDPEVAEDQGVAPLAFLELWAHALRAGGHGRIRGDVLVDATVFDAAYVHPDWEAGDLVKWYGAPIGGLNLANNCVEATIWPGPAVGAPARWSLAPETGLFQMDNRCRTVARGRGGAPAIGRMPGTFDLVLTGKVHDRVTLQAIAVEDPVAFTAAAIQHRLAERGIEFTGDLRPMRVRTPAGAIPDDVQVLARHRTPFTRVFQRVGRDSQNMCAEALFKRLGYAEARRRGTITGDAWPGGNWSNGREALSGFLHGLGCDLNTLTIADGSGLSRRNRATADEFVKVLAHMHTHPRREVFLESLAGNMTGGTLAREMRRVDGAVYAKTGYMSGVRALSGYVRGADDSGYAFSVIFNGFSGSSKPYRALLRKLCATLADSTGADVR